MWISKLAQFCDITGNGSGLKKETILTPAWRDRGNPRKGPIKKSGVRAVI